MTLQAGSRLGTYEILGLLGAGGMGEVYRARDRKLGREVAIKVLPDEFARDASRVARFEREARLLAAVSHSAIAAIYGAEEDGSTRYIVMELVAGDTLADRLTTGPLPVADALRIAAQIAEALEVAHEKGVIHRDLKPANIKITPEHKVKVLDFGLAKAMELPYSGDMSRTPTVVMDDSRPGEVVGTPEFMSPEQARGKDTDRRTDIWAFGCLLYEMLSGRRAFQGETVPDAIASILHHDPDWSALPARVPARVRDLLRRCLEKDTGRRLRDAGDARLELESALAEMSGAAGGADASSRLTWKSAAAALAIGVVVVATVYLTLRPRLAPSSSVSHQLAVLPFRNLTGKPEGDLMGLGMVDTISARLANVPGLQVVTPRAAIEASEGNYANIARRLGATTLLSGSLQRENDRYRITYRLLDAEGKQLAANAIDGSEIFPLQDRLADGVMRDLKLPHGARRTPTPSGLDTASEQERYLQAIGLLQRYDKTESVEQAIRILTALSAERPNSPLVHAALGRAYLHRFTLTRDPKWVDQAMEACRRARQLAPELSEVDVTEGELALQVGKAPEALAAYRKALAAQPSSFEATLGLARAHEANGDLPHAEETYRRAIALQPAYFGGYSQLAGFYWDRGRFEDAARAFQRVTELTPDNALAFANLGGTYLAQGQFEKALRSFEKSVALSPTDPAWSNIGTARYYLGAFPESAKAFEKALALEPKHYETWANLGDALLQIPARRSEAADAYAHSIALARQELATNPEDAQVHSYLALGLAKTGKTDEAEVHVRRSLAGGPDRPELLFNAAVVANRAGNPAEALEDLARAVRAGFAPSIIRNEPELAALRSQKGFEEALQRPKGP